MVIESAFGRLYGGGIPPQIPWFVPVWIVGNRGQAHAHKAASSERSAQVHVVGYVAARKSPLAIGATAIGIDVAHDHEKLLKTARGIRNDMVRQRIDFAVTFIAINADQMVADVMPAERQVRQGLLDELAVPIGSLAMAVGAILGIQISEQLEILAIDCS